MNSGRRDLVHPSRGSLVSRGHARSIGGDRTRPRPHHEAPLRPVAALALLALAACPPVQRPGTPTPPAAAEIAAPVARTWDAAADVLAERNLPVRTMDRASGFMSTDQMAVEGRDAKRWADCGAVLGTRSEADRATYSVLVRGDSVRSTARVTVRWTQGGRGGEELVECTTRGTLEAEVQAAIKARAEQRP